MPTILRIDGMRVMIYLNNHRPAHVHVIHGDCEAIFELNCPDGPVDMRASQNFSRTELRNIAGKLNAAIRSACLSWEQIHGDY